MTPYQPYLFKLGERGLYVSVTDYKGYLKVHVRFHCTDPVSGKSYPTKSGVTLSLDEWFDFKNQLRAVDETVNVTLDAQLNTRKHHEIISKYDGVNSVQDDPNREDIIKKACTLSGIQLQGNDRQNYDGFGHEDLIGPTNMNPQH